MDPLGIWAVNSVPTPFTNIYETIMNDQKLMKIGTILKNMKIEKIEKIEYELNILTISRLITILLITYYSKKQFVTIIFMIHRWTPTSYVC